MTVPMTASKDMETKRLSPISLGAAIGAASGAALHGRRLHASKLSVIGDSTMVVVSAEGQASHKRCSLLFTSQDWKRS